MRKKILSALLCATMAVSMLAGCGDKPDSSSGDSGNDGGNSAAAAGDSDDGGAGDGAEDGSGAAAALPEMTTEEIELTYMNFDNEVLTKYLAEKFTEKYPNIKVNIIYVAAGEEYNDTLLNLVNTRKTPDCFMILGNCDFALSNSLLGDMTEYWENDPENDNILPSINGAKLGYYGTNQKLSTPMKFFPDALYADMAVFEKLNVAMPPTDWTWDEMVQAFKDVTSPDEGIYGFNQFHSIVTYYPVAADPNCIGEFGWNGKEFDLTNWAVGVNTLGDLMKGKYRAPINDDNGEITAWLGSNEWAGFSGKIGFQIDAFWTYLNLFDTDEYRAKGIEFVSYATPSVEGSNAKYKFGVLDFGGISSGTKYPREAYELLKFMGWGLEGWQAKMEAYKTLTDPAVDDTPIWKQSMPAPLTMDEAIWTDYQTTFFPSLKDTEQDEKDQKYGKYFDDYFDQVKQGVVPFGDCQIPGFAGFVGAEGPYAGVEDSVFNGEKNASDWVAELTEKANEYNRQAMEDAGLTAAQ